MSADASSDDDETYAAKKVEAAVHGKLSVLPGHAPDMSAATFVVNEEDHTLGNALRYVLMKDPKVEFCGYSAPHPSEDKIHLRIQMYDGENAMLALLRALDNLKDLTESILEKYETDLGRKAYTTESDEPVMDWEDINARAEASRQRKREERDAAKKAVASSSRNVGR